MNHDALESKQWNELLQLRIQSLYTPPLARQSNPVQPRDAPKPSRLVLLLFWPPAGERREFVAGGSICRRFGLSQVRLRGLPTYHFPLHITYLFHHLIQHGLTLIEHASRIVPRLLKTALAPHRHFPSHAVGRPSWVLGIT